MVWEEREFLVIYLKKNNQIYLYDDIKNILIKKKILKNTIRKIKFTNIILIILLVQG